jgi:hypothetical protein
VRLWSAPASVRGEALFSRRGRGGLVFCRMGPLPSFFLLQSSLLSHAASWRGATPLPPSLAPSMSLACLTDGCPCG